MNNPSHSIRYGTVCSGIEAVTVAWENLGLVPAWFSEIDPFANAVLAHHYPHVPNLGDMTGVATKILSGQVFAPDILVGGTPCQAFSIAGLRQGLTDPRGALTLKYAEIANAIDETRTTQNQTPAILVWENVPGVLSDRNNAFGCFLGAITGEDRALQPAGEKWTHAGCIYGPQRSVAWRVLDAQYFGVAQRRKRVFVIASGRQNFDPAKVLFESESLRRDSPPRPNSRQEIAAGAASDPKTPSHFEEGPGETRTHPTVTAFFGGGNTRGPIDRAACLTARGHRIDFEGETFAVQGLAGSISHTLTSAHSVVEDGNGRGVPVVTVPQTDAFAVHAVTGPVSHTLNTANNGKGGSEDGSGRGVPIIAIHHHVGLELEGATQASESLAFTQHPRAELLWETHARQLEEATSTGGGTAGQGVPVVASVALRGRLHGMAAERGGAVTPALGASAGGGDKAFALLPTLDAHFQCTPVPASQGDRVDWSMWRVRRLMPLECERLQGLPDNFTLVPYRGKPATDGPRYKAVGNSMAVPCVTWIGQRILNALGRANSS